MKKLLIVLMCLGMTGCANFLTTTATSGTSFGMSKENVLARLENKYRLLYKTEHVIIFEGMQEQLKQPALKGFLFQDNHLAMASDYILATDLGSNIDKEEAIVIANFLLNIEGFNVKEKIIEADERNAKWDMYYLSNKQFIQANPHIVESLQNRDYWAINYSPKEQNIIGGGAWVFVDKKTGEIILIFYEE